jgi:hypothetical protein
MILFSSYAFQQVLLEPAGNQFFLFWSLFRVAAPPTSDHSGETENRIHA